MSTMSGISVQLNSTTTNRGDGKQVGTVAGLGQWLREPRELLGIDVTRAERNFLWATDLQPLPGLDGLDERRCLEQRLVSACIEPRYSSPEKLHLQRASRQVGAIDVRNLEFTPGGGLQPRGD